MTMLFIPWWQNYTNRRRIESCYWVWRLHFCCVLESLLWLALASSAHESGLAMQELILVGCWEGCSVESKKTLTMFFFIVRSIICRMPAWNDQRQKCKPIIFHHGGKSITTFKKYVPPRSDSNSPLAVFSALSIQLSYASIALIPLSCPLVFIVDSKHVESWKTTLLPIAERLASRKVIAAESAAAYEVNPSSFWEE